MKWRMVIVSFGALIRSRVGRATVGSDKKAGGISDMFIDMCSAVGISVHSVLEVLYSPMPFQHGASCRDQRGDGPLEADRRTSANGNPFLPERVEAERLAVLRRGLRRHARRRVARGGRPERPEPQCATACAGPGRRSSAAGLQRDRLGRRGAKASERGARPSTRFWSVYYLLYHALRGRVHEARPDRGGPRRALHDHGPWPAESRFFASDVGHFFQLPERDASPSRQSGPRLPLRVGLPDPARLPPHLPAASTGAPCPPPGCARRSGSRSSPTTCPPLPTLALRPHRATSPTLVTGRVGHGQGAGRPGHRDVALHPLRPAPRQRFVEDFAARRSSRREPLGAVADPGRVGALRPSASGSFTGATQDRRRLAGELSGTARLGVPGRDRRELDTGHPGEAAAGAPEPASSSASARPPSAASRGSSSRPPTATWRRRCERVASGPTSTIGSARIASRRPTLREQLAGLARASCAAPGARARPAHRRDADEAPGARRRWSPGSTKHLGAPTTRGRATCASSSSACATCSCGGAYRAGATCAGHRRGAWRPPSLREGRLSADELLRRYCTEVYLRAHRELRGGGPPAGPRPADREGEGGSRS